MYAVRWFARWCHSITLEIFHKFLLLVFSSISTILTLLSHCHIARTLSHTCIVRTQHNHNNKGRVGGHVAVRPTSESSSQNDKIRCIWRRPTVDVLHAAVRRVNGEKVCYVSVKMTCAGDDCRPIVNSTNLDVNTTMTSDCTSVAVKCPLTGQTLANMVSIYTCSNGGWAPMPPRSCVGRYYEYVASQDRWTENA